MNHWMLIKNIFIMLPGNFVVFNAIKNVYNIELNTIIKKIVFLLLRIKF